MCEKLINSSRPDCIRAAAARGSVGITTLLAGGEGNLWFCVPPSPASARAGVVSRVLVWWLRSLRVQGCSVPGGEGAGGWHGAGGSRGCAPCGTALLRRCLGQGRAAAPAKGSHQLCTEQCPGLVPGLGGQSGPGPLGGKCCRQSLACVSVRLRARDTPRTGRCLPLWCPPTASVPMPVLFRFLAAMSETSDLWGDGNHTDLLSPR